MNRVRPFAASVLVVFLATVTLVQAETDINVVYPKPDQVIGAVDSSFIFGSVSGDFDPEEDWLLVNGETIPVHRDGGFLAFLPIEPGPFDFRLQAMRRSAVPLANRPLQRYQLLAEMHVPVVVPEPLASLPDDSLQIVGDYRGPSGDLVLRTGDVLPVRFQGTPGLRAWFAIPGVADSVPMSELEPSQQPYWGESVFGIGAVPDSVLIRGIYEGFYVVPDSVSVLDVHLAYYLASPSTKYLRPSALVGVEINPDSAAHYDSALMIAGEQQVEAQSRFKVSLNRPDYPVTVRFLDSVQTIRYGPVLGYFAIFQPAGVEALAVGREGDWYRLQLSSNQYAWAVGSSLQVLEPGILPPHSRIAVIRSYGAPDHLLLELGLSGKHPYRVHVDNRRTLRLQLFGVTSNTDWIRYDFSDPLVDLASWSQPEDLMYELKLQLTQDLWGYDCYYEGNSFYLKLNKPPEKVKEVWGKTIVIDPGHSSDVGAVGPTGLTEAEANLGISLALRKELRKKGAQVVMTRDDMSHVSLYDRPTIAKLAKADLFVSVHNNALPDGVNPFTNHGVSTYYYHPHSIGLARSIQGELLKETRMPDFGLYHGNLAVNRPTQYPAVLVECAFMMIPEQEALLKTERYQKKVAKAIAKGIENFLKQYEQDNK